MESVASPAQHVSPVTRYPLPPSPQYWSSTLDAYCINLERRVDRWVEVQAAFEPLTPSIRLTRFHAVDGKSDAATLSCDVERVWDSTANAKWDPRTEPGMRLKMSRGEVGCALSHVALWRMVADAGATPTLVTEDDVGFEEDAAESIAAILAVAPAGWHLIYLGYYRPHKAALEPVVGTDGLLARPEFLYHTHGYLISSDGAQALLSALPVNQPVDCFMASLFPQLDVYAATPQVCYQRNGSQSEDSDVRPSCARAQRDSPSNAPKSAMSALLLRLASKATS